MKNEDARVPMIEITSKKEAPYWSMKIIGVSISEAEVLELSRLISTFLKERERIGVED